MTWLDDTLFFTSSLGAIRGHGIYLHKILLHINRFTVCSYRVILHVTLDTLYTHLFLHNIILTQ